MNAKLSTILLILCFGNTLGLAQAAKEKAAPTGLALEVTFIKGRPPAYITIGDSLATAQWAWYEAFERLPNLPASADKLPVQAVKFIPFIEDGAIKVRVKIITGQKSFEKEDTIALYSVRENERVSVKELTDYGVVPFEIAVVRVAPNVSDLPAVENKTKSLQVTSIEPNFSTLPSYKISLLNASDKPVSAFTCETVADGRVKLSLMPQNQHGEYLIEPGETIVREMRSALEYKQPVEGETPKQAVRQTIVISSVIFADGSYEGNSVRAAQFRAYALGRKAQIKQIIALLESDENASSEFNWNKFVEQSAKLDTKINESEFSLLLKQFPSTEAEKAYLREGVEGASDDIKKEFTSGTQRHREELESPEDSHAYLKALRELYQKWLAQFP